MDQWLKWGGLNKQVIRGATDVVIESQRFKSPSVIDCFSTAESSTKRKYSESSLYLVFTYTGDEISRDALYVLCNQVLPNNPRYVRNFLHSDANHAACKDKDISFFKRMMKKLTSCKSFMVKS